MLKRDWRRKIGPMRGLRRQFKILLEQIAECFAITGELFDEHFRLELFQLTNDA